MTHRSDQSTRSPSEEVRAHGGGGGGSGRSASGVGGGDTHRSDRVSARGTGNEGLSVTKAENGYGSAGGGPVPSLRGRSEEVVFDSVVSVHRGPEFTATFEPLPPKVRKAKEKEREREWVAHGLDHLICNIGSSRVSTTFSLNDLICYVQERKFYGFEDANLLSKMFKEADFKNDGQLDKEELEKAISGKFRFRQHSQDWRTLVSLILGPKNIQQVKIDRPERRDASHSSTSHSAPNTHRSTASTRRCPRVTVSRPSTSKGFSAPASRPTTSNAAAQNSFAPLEGDHPPSSQTSRDLPNWQSLLADHAHRNPPPRGSTAPSVMGVKNHGAKLGGWELPGVDVPAAVVPATDGSAAINNMLFSHRSAREPFNQDTFRAAPSLSTLDSARSMPCTSRAVADTPLVTFEAKKQFKSFAEKKVYATRDNVPVMPNCLKQTLYCTTFKEESDYPKSPPDFDSVFHLPSNQNLRVSAAQSQAEMKGAYSTKQHEFRDPYNPEWDGKPQFATSFRASANGLGDRFVLGSYFNATDVSKQKMQEVWAVQASKMHAVHPKQFDTVAKHPSLINQHDPSYYFELRADRPEKTTSDAMLARKYPEMFQPQPQFVTNFRTVKPADKRANIGIQFDPTPLFVQDRIR